MQHKMQDVNDFFHDIQLVARELLQKFSGMGIISKIGIIFIKFGAVAVASLFGY